MALPPAEELSRWTVGQVTTWLSQCSLTAFREVFLSDSIDGSKLMRLTREDVDNKYGKISSKKRLVLKDHLDKLPPARAAPPSWANPPQLPPRTQGGARAPAPPPVQSQRTFDEFDDSDEDGWDDDFDDDMEEDYLEPTAAIRPSTPPRPGQNNGQSRTAHPSEPQSVYEIPEETTQSRQAPRTGLARNETMVDRLRNELAKKRQSATTSQSSVAVSRKGAVRKRKSQGGNGGTQSTSRGAMSLGAGANAHHIPTWDEVDGVSAAERPPSGVGGDVEHIYEKIESVPGSESLYEALTARNIEPVSSSESPYEALNAGKIENRLCRTSAPVDDYEEDEEEGDDDDYISPISTRPCSSSDDDTYCKPLPIFQSLGESRVVERPDEKPERPPRRPITRSCTESLPERNGPRREAPPSESDSDSDDESYIEPVTSPHHAGAEPAPGVPPPRPPRGRTGMPPPPPAAAATSINNVAPPEDVYEITNDSPNKDDELYQHPDTTQTSPNSYLDFSETCKVEHGTPSRRANHAPAAEPMDNLARYPWYHGKITRDLAKQIFEREQQDGMFLIRLSDRDPKQPYTLVIWHCNRIWNLPIRLLNNNNYALGKMKEGETESPSLIELVKHFKVVSLNLKSTADQTQGSGRLTVAAPKR